MQKKKSGSMSYDPYKGTLQLEEEVPLLWGKQQPLIQSEACSTGGNSFLALEAQLTAHAWEGLRPKWEATTVVELS